MSGSYNHTNQAGGYTNYSGRPVYVMAIGETRGACFDCPGISHDKTCYGCENCARLRKGLSDCWNPLEYRDRPELSITPNSTAHLTECAMPGCTRMAKLEYCATCLSRRNNRKAQWKRDHRDSEAPEWFLNRPVETKERVPRKCKAYNYHSDDKPHASIIDYPAKLKMAQDRGYSSYKEMTIKVYEKHRSLRKACDELGMSLGGLRYWFHKIKYPILGVGRPVVKTANT